MDLPAWAPTIIAQLIGIAVMVGMHWQTVAQHEKELEKLGRDKADTSVIASLAEHIHDIKRTKVDRDGYIEAIRRLDGDIAQVVHFAKGVETRLLDMERKR
jgi:hypothetical protein